MSSKMVMRGQAKGRSPSLVRGEQLSTYTQQLGELTYFLEGRKRMFHSMSERSGWELAIRGHER